MNDKPTTQKKSGRKIALFILRWGLLGWWAVPLLAALRFFAEINETYWTGDATQIYWHHDDTMGALAEWCSKRLQFFFPKRPENPA
jgi:hypothetical protein